jgi:hypothetical protein
MAKIERTDNTMARNRKDEGINNENTTQKNTSGSETRIP